ncbi:hypothetical protein Hypma_009909 [Hypsizygus marmoreus]|uniref:Uncharacterized protein n=1 Tax=Hypsizygus marmoreus TaxID=39966 RepID=A0A369JUH8_HYPMA|nr:hypothetical protein Hypma_009909 [Hypsizygus marmoreus]
MFIDNQRTPNPITGMCFTAGSSSYYEMTLGDRMESLTMLLRHADLPPSFSLADSRVESATAAQVAFSMLQRFRGLIDIVSQRQIPICEMKLATAPFFIFDDQ